MAARQTIVKTTLAYLEHLQNENGLNDKMRLALAAGYYKISLIQWNFAGPSLQDFAGAQSSLLKLDVVLRPLFFRKNSDPVVLLSWIEIESQLADLDYRNGKEQEAIGINLALLPVAHRVAQLRPGDPVAAKQEPALENSLALAYLRKPGPEGLQHAERTGTDAGGAPATSGRCGDRTVRRNPASSGSGGAHRCRRVGEGRK